MHPVDVSAGSVSSGTFRFALKVFSGSPDFLTVHDEVGRKISLPSDFTATNLPAHLYLSAQASGEALLSLVWLGSEAKGGDPLLDEIRVRAGPFPGLAGETTLEYPHFQFPLAINRNQALQVAVDPQRHAERVGLPFDIYVIRHRPPEEWASDRLLVDVTAEVERSKLFEGGVEDNVHDVWQPGLDGAAGDGLGAPYNVVLDFGLDGQLDPGDLIDRFDAEQAGFYVVRDTTVGGPFGFQSFEFDDDSLFRTQGFDGGTTRNMRSQGLVVYPSPLPEGKLPLVTFSHGNTGIRTSYLGYRYLQEHLASYGFITASFDMFPGHVATGIRWRGWLTNKNTERLILQTQLHDHNGTPYPPMGGGVLDGRVDGDRIITVGHSRGGEGVLLQYQQVANPDIPNIRPPGGVLRGFDRDSFLGIVTIAETTFLSRGEGSRPGDRNYFQFFGGADADVCGCVRQAVPTYHYHRGLGNKAQIYMYGAGHGYFNDQWPCTCTGPITMTRFEVKQVTKGYLLPFVLLAARDNIPAKDFFTRAPTRFRPIGTQDFPPARRWTNLYEDHRTQNYVIDDFESNSSQFVSSSGQPVFFTVSNLFEGGFNDTNPAGGWSANEPDGGFWWATKGAIFDWNGTAFEYCFALAKTEQDLSDDAALQFITCQQADHPETLASHSARNLTVTLLDAKGGRSSINTRSLGGIDKTHLRGGGWGSAFKTYRIPLPAFVANGSGLDLQHIREIRFEFGSDHGSQQGRLGLDNIVIVRP
jgi:hypothetical protein